LRAAVRVSGADLLGLGQTAQSVHKAPFTKTGGAPPSTERFAMLHNDHLEQWDRENFFHPSTHLADFARGDLPHRVVTGGAGSHIHTRDGKQLLDAFAGLYCVNVGYGRSEIAQAIADQARELAYYHAYVGHGTEASITLSKMILDRAPDHMSKVYFGLSGSDANETNIKLIWYYNNILGRPEKKKIISRWRGYHGSGLMTGSLTGLDLFHAKFDLPLAQVVHTEAPYYFRRADLAQSEEAFVAHCVAELEALIAREGADTIAAFIGEPVLGTGGIVPPPTGYWEAIQAVLDKHDILLVADEVVTGFGRLGTMFGSDHYGMRPDLITIAKGLTSAYAPLSGSIVSDKMWKVLEQGTDENGPIGHGWTYSAHPIGAAAGVANLKLLDDLNLVENAASVGGHLNAAMRDALSDHANVGDVRGEGMLCAVEFVADKADRTFFDASEKIGPQIAAKLLEQDDIIARAMPQGDILGFAPPFSLSRDEADRIVSATARAVQAVLG
jgi:L-2,4-diaminobutyrate transaminase